MEKSVPLKEELNVIHSPLRHRVVAYYTEPCSTRVGPEAEAGARGKRGPQPLLGFSREKARQGSVNSIGLAKFE